ncbi:O-antigen ligase family protein [Proteus vulgaris]
MNKNYYLMNKLSIISLLLIYLSLITDKLKYSLETNLIIITAFLISLMILIYNRFKIIKSNIIFILPIYFSIYIGIISTILGNDIEGIISIIKFFCFIFIASRISTYLLGNIEKITLLSTYYLILVIIVIIFLYGENLGRNFKGPFLNQNSLGMILSLGVYFSLLSIFINKNKLKIAISSFALLISIPILLYTNSRTAILSPFVAIGTIIFFSLFTIKTLNIKKILLTFFCISIIITALFLLQDILNETILEKFNRKSNDLTSGRLDFIKATIPYLNYLSSSKIPEHIVIDNTLVAYAANFGIISLFFLILIYISYPFIWIYVRNQLTYSQSLFISSFYIYYVFYSLLESMRISPNTLIFFASYFFLCYKSKNKNNETTKR